MKKDKKKNNYGWLEGEEALHLDKPTSHGGWPGGDYDPPVNVFLSDYFKSMGLMTGKKKRKQYKQISLKELRSLINECASDCMESDHPGRMLDYGHKKSDSKEGRMSKQHLFDIVQKAATLHDELQDNDDIPQWCSEYIAICADRLHVVTDYLRYKIIRKENK